MANNSLVILITVAIIGISAFWFILLMLVAWKTRRLRKNYNESQDLSKQGELRRYEGHSEFRIPTGNSAEHGYRELVERELIAKGLVQPKGRQLLPPTAPSSVGEVSNSNGETSRQPRNIFEALKFRKQ